MYTLLYHAIIYIYYIYAIYIYLVKLVKSQGSLKNIRTRKEIFSEPCFSRSNLDWNYHFSIDLAPIGILFAVPNQLEKVNYNPNLARFHKTQKIYPVYIIFFGGVSVSCQLEWNMIVSTIFQLILNVYWCLIHRKIVNAKHIIF